MVAKKTTTKSKKVFTTRKYMGDDLYSWAVFKKGQSKPVATGQDTNSARAIARRLQREHDAKQAVQSLDDRDMISLEVNKS